MVCFDDVLDDEMESVATAKTVDTAVDNSIDEFTTVRAEVDKVYQSLQRMRGMTSGNKPAEKSARKNNKRELTGLMDGLASMGCVKRRRL